LVSATSDIEIPRYTRVVNPTILDFIPENVEEAMKNAQRHRRQPLATVYIHKQPKPENRN
jgi:hypothetical protein